MTSDPGSKVEDERLKMRLSETSHKEMSLQWLKERDDLRQLMADAKAKADQSAALLVTKETKFKEAVHFYLLHRSSFSFVSFRLLKARHCWIDDNRNLSNHHNDEFINLWYWFNVFIWIMLDPNCMILVLCCGNAENSLILFLSLWRWFVTAMALNVTGDSCQGRTEERSGRSQSQSRKRNQIGQRRSCQLQSQTGWHGTETNSGS